LYHFLVYIKASPQMFATGTLLSEFCHFCLVYILYQCFQDAWRKGLQSNSTV